MAALYPTAPPSFSPRTNLTDIVNAVDVNKAYDEITAIAGAVGLTPATRSGNWGVTTPGGPDISGLTFSSVGARIRNVEDGMYIAYTDRVKSSGGSTILAGNTSTVTLTVRSYASQTANLLEAKNSSGTVVTWITPSGQFRTDAGIDGGSA